MTILAKHDIGFCMNFYDDVGRHENAIALVTETGEKISYRELGQSADSLSSKLEGHGLAFLLVDNSKASVAGYLACLRSRTPAALLASGLHPDLLARLLQEYRPCHVWLPAGRASEVPNGVERASQDTHVLLATDANRPVIHEDLALLMTTSGSTGSPKFVRQSHRNISANTDAISEYLEIGPQDRAISSLPMHYVFGLSVINSHLFRGASIVLTNKGPAEKGFWDLVRSEQATSFAGVPFTYEMLKRLRFGRMSLPSLKVLTQAGGKLDAASVAEFAELCESKSMRFFVMYGAAEATARMAYLPPSEAREKPSSIGVAIPGGEFWLEDETGVVIESSGVVGELCFRGDNVTMGYATCRGDLAKGDERGKVLRTGDMAKRDEQGYYFVVGRKSRFLKIFGNRVNLEELEQLIRKQGFDCACAGEDDHLCIYITKAGQQEVVMQFVQNLTKLHHSAYRVVVLDHIPRNESGKILYASLPARAQNSAAKAIETLAMTPQ